MFARSPLGIMRAMDHRRAIALFTRDLRVADSPLLAHASQAADEVIPLFVLERGQLARSPLRAAFLIGSLHGLAAALAQRGGRLVVRQGDAAAETATLAAELDATLVVVAADATAYATRRLAAIRVALPRVEVRSVPGVAGVDPGTVHPHGRDHYRVFTPYGAAWRKAPWRVAAPAPTDLRTPPGIASLPLPGPHRGPIAGWAVPGEAAGAARVAAYLRGGRDGYGTARDDPAADATSRLAPWLHLGCVSPLQLALAVGDGPFQRQLAWRDFYLQLVAANPGALRADLVGRRAPWLEDAEGLAAWCAARTGFPFVDAGLRQLAQEGFMHNRLRMVVASFLTKDLLVHWREGAAHFDRLLLDGDPASNVSNWQWAAGCGVDTQPGRIFNPWIQAARFDPAGAYTRRYLPELAGVSDAGLLDPDGAERRRVVPGYPAPIVDHAHAARRFRTLDRRYA